MAPMGAGPGFLNPGLAPGVFQPSLNDIHVEQFWPSEWPNLDFWSFD